MNENIIKSIKLLKKFDNNLEPVLCFLYEGNYIFNVKVNGEYTLGNNYYIVDLKNNKVSIFNMINIDEKEKQKFSKPINLI